MKRLAWSFLLVLLAAIIIFFSYCPVRQPNHWPIQYPTAQFSIDDVREINSALQVGDKESIFEEPLLSQLRDWHDKYGIVASLYIQGPFLINSRYADELKENSDWLRWGYHGEGEQRRKNGIGAFARQLRDSIGTMDVMDRSVRVDYYHADLISCLKYRIMGVKAFLTADDWEYNAERRKTNYYLTSAQSNGLEDADILYDPIHDIAFVKTDIRIEHIKGDAHIPSSIHMLDESNTNPDLLTIFTHERMFEDHLYIMDSLFYSIQKMVISLASHIDAV